MFWNIIMWFASFMVIATKYLDCITTTRHLVEIRQEQNPMARWLMRKIGVRTTIWGIFAVVVVVVAGLNVVVWIQGLNWDGKLAFAVIALIVAGAQGAVAHTNATGRLNAFTRILMREWGGGH